MPIAPPQSVLGASIAAHDLLRGTGAWWCEREALAPVTEEETAEDEDDETATRSH